ncbi:MAG: tRNA glutamyl-Q synthetase [Acidobacteria bacterium]|nr:MAG: tRNA glutamyl-Q synthetase [Acidobacteriota bacterium]
MPEKVGDYRGRLAPSPTGLLHLGHARTFWIAAQRASECGGSLILRNENLDPQRCRQSERRDFYLEAWRKLRDAGAVYPCTCSRKDVAEVAAAPNNDTDDEPIYPGTCRRRTDAFAFSSPAGVNWRFRVPEGEQIVFEDVNLGPQQYVAGKDFGDFLVWRRDDVPAYQLAVVVDDAAMKVTEVVRGADLLKSTARQMLIYRALRLQLPRHYHCDLARDESGNRLAKRHDSLSIRRLRESGWTPEQVLKAAGPA